MKNTIRLSDSKLQVMMARNVFTTSDLAKSYGVSRARMNAILNSREVTTVCAGKLAKALNCDVTEIIE